MATLAEKRTWRQDALLALYDLTDGSTMSSSTLGEVAKLAGVPEDEIYNTVDFLQGEDQAEITTMGGLAASVEISADGIRFAEELLDRGVVAPVAVAIFTDVELRQHLEPVLTSIEAAITEGDLPTEEEVDLRADVQSATDQLRAIRPNRGVIKAALSRAYGVLQVAAVTGGVLEGIDTVLRRLGV
jgi:hypothetical protein